MLASQLKSLKVADILILFSVVVFLAWLYYSFWHRPSHNLVADTLIVQTMDHAPQYFNLKHDQILRIEGAKGYSLIEIQHNQARFVQSTCRNKFCILHGWLDTPGDIIACLPNQLSISLQSTENEYDALNY